MIDWYNMASPHWQLQNPISAITFDCDGTLSAIEGIDELAKERGVYTEIHALTAEAMSKTGVNPELYAKRLNLVQPTKNAVSALAQRYYDMRVPHLIEVINILKQLNKAIYVISAGLHPAVNQFANWLQIPSEHVFAVNVSFDADGNYANFDRHSPLIYNDGKQKIITELKQRHANLVHVGDGLNDMLPHHLVTRLIGYGGVYFRENIAALCHYYITSPSIATLLPLILTQTECQQLNSADQQWIAQGINAIKKGEVLHCV